MAKKGGGLAAPEHASFLRKATLINILKLIEV